MTKIPSYLAKGVSALMSNDPFHAAMLVHVDLIEIDDVTPPVADAPPPDPFLSKIQTAATNGLNKIWYSRKWIENMPIGCSATVLAHEVQHIVRLHLGMTMDRAFEAVAHHRLKPEGLAMLWNVAGDAVINKSLVDMGYPVKDVIPDTTGVTLDDYKRWLSGQPVDKTGSILDMSVRPSDTTSDIFFDLVNHIVANPPPPPSGGGNESGMGSGADINGMGSDLTPEQLKQELEAQGMTPEQAQAMVESAIVAAVQSARERGDLPRYIKGIVDDLNKPFNNWRQSLRRFFRHQAREDFSFRRISRRTAGDMNAPEDTYMIRPSLYSDKLGEVVCIIDESGSVSDKELQQGLAEITDLAKSLKPTGVTVVVCDTRVTGTSRFKPGEKIVVKTGGRGGTDMAPAFEWVRDNVRDAVCIVCFTDGELNFYTKAIAKVPVIWAICNPEMKNGMKAPWGVTINIEVQE